MRTPLTASPRDLFRFGFLATLGAVAMLALAWVAIRLGLAVLDVVSPFVVGLALAFFLDPLVHRLQRRGMTRLQAVGIVFLALIVLIAVIGSLIVPAIANEASDLATNGPAYLNGVREKVDIFLTRHRHMAGVALPKNFNGLLSEVSAKTSSYLQQSSGQLVGYVLNSVGFLLDSVITLIVTFYLLADLDRFRARLLFLTPENRRRIATRIAKDVGQVFTDYLRGLLIVCVLFGVTTTITLYILALFHHGIAKYALLIGAIAGLLYAIPYLGALTTAVLAFIVAYASGGPVFGLIALAAIIVLEQGFDNLVTPRLVGGGVGLHPVVAIFALVLGAHLFGIVGMVMAVPVVASIQVILFRVFPKLTAPTPASLLQREGVPPADGESEKYMAGEDSPTEEHKEEKKENEP